MTLDETVEKLRVYLEDWYASRIKSNPRLIQPEELKYSKNKFMEENPECKKHEFDIYYDVQAIENSYCGCLCCDNNGLRVKVKGVIVKSVDWDQVYKNTFYEASSYSLSKLYKKIVSGIPKTLVDKLR